MPKRWRFTIAIALTVVAIREDAVRLVGLIMNAISEADEALAGEVAGELDVLPPEEQPAFNGLVAMIRPLRKVWLQRPMRQHPVAPGCR